MTDRLKNHVHVIRHNAPSKKFIAVAIEEFQGIRDDGGNFILLKPTGAISGIEPLLDLL